MAFSIRKIFDNKTNGVKELEPFVKKINELEEKTASFSDLEFPKKTNEFKERVAKGELLDTVLPEAYALVREASKRTLGQRHFDVQLMGGIAMHQGKIAEMKTGEGKTLVATLPAYLNALTKKGVHVITVNDYLSKRDAIWMGQIYDFLGLSVAVINHGSSFIYDKSYKKEKVEELDQERDEIGAFHIIEEFLRPVTRREAYEADITYGTNSEFGFDYLRDNLEYEKNRLRQREHNFVIVDEIDSILIDEARTPLIISAPTTESESLYATFADIAKKLKQDEHYTVDEKFKSINMTESGIEEAERLLGVDNIYTEKGIKYVHHLETAVRAKALFNKDKEYVVRDGQVVIVDEFTGRMQPGRRWSEGLHQAIEAKENVPVQKESRTFASITYQNYFRMYEKLSGMTGTAETSSEEFYKVYGLPVVVVPTNESIQRVDRNDQIFQTEEGKFKAIARKVKELNEKGQPVLIGTVSIEKNELLSAYLKKEGVKHEILNAKQHQKEGEVIAQAGRKGAVTISTNMAGRGVDIKLGGNPSTNEEYEEIKKIGGLFVLGTERHEARRIDNQLRGRSGRQGDPGETQFFVSLEDSLMRVFASDAIKKMMGRFGIPEDQPIENRLITNSLEKAQERIEGFHFDARKHVLQYDDVLNFQRQIVYERRRDILLGDGKEIKKRAKEIFERADFEHINILETKEKELGEGAFIEGLRVVLLQTMDLFWVDHLEMMDYMRSSVGLRAYGQRDPLVEYRKEGLRLFKEMEASIDEEVVKLVPHLVNKQFATEETEVREIKRAADSITSQTDTQIQSAEQDNKYKNVGRNDLCPCGSGKKFKKCHGK